MARFALNHKKANNYAFFCPVSRLHLTRSNPIGMTDGVTPAILRGLRTKAILDIDGVVDMEKSILKTAQTASTNEPPADNGNQQEDAPKKRGRQKKNEANQETQPSEPAVEPPIEPTGPTEPAEDTEGSEQADE